MENFDIVETIKSLVASYQDLANEVAEIKNAVMDELINPIRTEYEQMQHDNALSDFRCKYGEKLEGFNDKLKSLEGEDFDIVEKAFEDFSARDDGMDEEVYVEKLAEKVQEQLDAIATAFGVAPENIEEVKVETADGEVEAEVENGEVVSVEGEDTNETEETDTNTESDEQTVDVEPQSEPVEDEPVEEAEADETKETDEAKEEDIDWEEELKKVGGKSKADFLRV